MALTNISGIPDKHWQPPFVAFETTQVYTNYHLYFSFVLFNLAKYNNNCKNKKVYYDIMIF